MRPWLYFLSAVALASWAVADTPPPAKVQSRTLDGSGTNQITSTLVSGKQGLDVNIAGGSVSVTGSLGRTWTLNSGSDSVTSVQGTSPWVENLTQVGGSSVSLGQAVMASSFPVAIASNQSAIPSSQSGIWTVQPGNTANTTPWLMTINQGGNSATVTGANALKVDGSAVTQPVSQVGAPWSSNVTQYGGTNLSTGTGAGGAGIPRVTVSNDSTIRIWDGTNTETVKAASTAAAAADTSKVVAISPNSPPPAFLDQSTSGSLGALNATVVLSNMHGMSGVLFQLTGTWVGTILAEASIDGSNWTTVNTAPIPGGTFVTTGATTNGLYRGASVSAYTSYRLRMSAYTSGSASVVINASGAPGTVQSFQFNSANLNAQVVGDSASLASDSGSNPIKTGAVYNSNLPSPSSGNRVDLQATARGELAVRTRNKYTHIAGNATTTVKSGAGELSRICFNFPQTGTATIYDNTAGSGTVIGIVTLPTGGVNPVPNCMVYGVEFSTGLTIVTAGSASNDLTVAWQ